MPAAPLSAGVVEFVADPSAGDVSVTAGPVASLTTVTVSDAALVAVHEAYVATTLYV